MSVIRTMKTDNFTVMSNHHLNDNTLSLKAKGLLSIMLSLPDDWVYSVRGLATRCKEGVGSVNAALQELEEAGYLLRKQRRNDKGHLVNMEYTVFETLELARKESEKADTPHMENPHMENPHMEKPYTENPHTDNPCTDNPCADNPCAESAAQVNTKGQNTHKPSTHKPSTHKPSTHTVSPSRPSESTDRMTEAQYAAVLAQTKERLACSVLREEYGDSVDACAEIIAEVLCNGAKTIRIEGNDYPADIVRSRMRRIDSLTVQDVLDSITAGGYMIKNRKAYLRTALYNVTATPNAYIN